MAGFREKITRVKRKRKLYGFRGLAFIIQSTHAPSARTIDSNHLKKWVINNYSQGVEQDTVRKEDIWKHFKEDNAVPEEYRDQFFSYLGQYVFSTEPYAKVQVAIRKKKRLGYCFLRRIATATNGAGEASRHDVDEDFVPCFVEEAVHEDVDDENIEGESLDVVKSMMHEPSSEIDTKREPVRVSDSQVDREASDESNNEREEKIKLIDVRNSSEEHSDVESPDSKEASFATAEGEEHTAKRFYHLHHVPVDEERSNESSTKREENNFKPIEVEDSPEEQSDLEYPVSKEASLSVTEGEEGTAKRFYRQHHKAIKKLLPSQLPGSYKTFQSFLQEVFPNSKAVSGSPIEAAGVNSSLAVSRMRAFLAVAFPPAIVGSLATEHVQAAEQGEHFPQFSHISGSTIKCEICIPHQRWAIENHEKHHKLKAKQVTIQGILEGTAILSFSGIVQAEEHSRSKYHQDALQFFIAEKPPMKMKDPSTEKMRNKAPKNITTYFKAPLN